MAAAAATMPLAGVPAARAQSTQAAGPLVTFALEQDHYFTSGGARLHGRLFAPSADGRFPAVLYVAGGGNYSLMGDAYARNTVKAFTDAGIAVFMFDKRGQGKSEGSYPAAELGDRTADTLAAFDTMASLQQVDPDRLGIWAISQAGYFIAPAMAARPSADFLILISPAGEAPVRHFETLTRRQLGKAGLSGGDLEEAVALWAELMRYFGTAEGYESAKALLAAAEAEPWHARARTVEYWADLPASAAELKTPLQLREAWTAKPQDYDWLRAPEHRRSYEADYRSIRQPVLLVFGDADSLIDVGASREAFVAAWEGRRDTTVVTFSGGGHGIQRKGDAENPMREYLDLATAWARRHFKSE